MLFGLTLNVRAQAIDGIAAIDGNRDEVVDVLAQLPASAPPPPDVLPSKAFQGAIVGDLQVSGHSIPVPLNQRVLDYVSLFQGRLHDFMEDGMRWGSKYLPMIQGVLRAEGLPLDLAYVLLVESAFNPNALSLGPGQRRLAVHEGHGSRERPQVGLVHRRAIGSRKGDQGRRELPEDAG